MVSTLKRSVVVLVTYTVIVCALLFWMHFRYIDEIDSKKGKNCGREKVIKSRKGEKLKKHDVTNEVKIYKNKLRR